ncbi:IS605 family transposase OrfB [Ammonifex degensii KC4]|uniref:IS605 family transposase OrfB n=1 Tax=Ammonifex degensii (strain DSM 10501 / KC4) TaxID=429009 RepID=C9R9B5_AMMDK|nr:transposase [Ammonifex degensii]ACX52894.1 IS605 family transposase OrfB [Ammonifex degensii KC4]
MKLLATYQTRIDDKGCYPFLEACGEYFGRLERKLYVDYHIKGSQVKELKRRYIAEHGITARQFNSLMGDLTARLASVRENLRWRERDLLGRIESVEQAIKKKEKEREKLLKSLAKLVPRSEEWQKKVDRLKKVKFVLHQKKRRLRNLRHKLEAVRRDLESGRYPVCFGGRKLFKAQHNLEANGFRDHAEWLRAWREARSGNFLVLGSKDEACGNQTCTYTKDNTLRVRVPERLRAGFGRWVLIESVRFPYGQEHLDRAKRPVCVVRGRKIYRPVTYRFVRRKGAWYLFATVERDDPAPSTSRWNGAVGVDLNDGFLQVGEVDRSGNPVGEFEIPVPMRDRTRGQIAAALGEAIKEVVLYAKEKGKPVAIEDLDFTAKKRGLRESNSRYARMLSGFAYRKFRAMVESCCSREGVELLKPEGKHVDPFATSVIGQLKFMARYGLSPHGAAACVIARRGLGFGLERAPEVSVLRLPSRGRASRRGYWRRVCESLKRGPGFGLRVDVLYADRF